MITLTVEKLLDIVYSQILLHGNRRLFIRRQDEFAESFNILVGEHSPNSIFECVGKYDSVFGEHCLSTLADRLEEFEAEVEIFCSDDERVLRGFQLGFISKEEGFTETINSSEFAQPTRV